MIKDGPRFPGGRIDGVKPAIALDLRRGPFVKDRGSWGGWATLQGTFGTNIVHDVDEQATKFTSANQYLELATDDFPTFADKLKTQCTIVCRFRQTTYKAQTAMLGCADVPYRFNAHIPWDSSVYWDFGDTGSDYRISYSPGFSQAQWQDYRTWVFTVGPLGARVYERYVLRTSRGTAAAARVPQSEKIWINRGAANNTGAASAWQMFVMYPHQVQDEVACWLSGGDNCFSLFDYSTDIELLAMLTKVGVAPPPGPPKGSLSLLGVGR